MAEDTTDLSAAVSTLTAPTIVDTTPVESSIVNPTGTFYSSHAAFVDNFGALFTILSCGIAGYQILQHLRHYH